MVAMVDLLISPTNPEAIALALARPNYVTEDVTQAFLEQRNDEAAIIAILIIGILVTLTLLLRCYSRIYVQRHFGLDDVLAILTIVSLPLELATLPKMGVESNTNMSAALRCIRRPVSYHDKTWSWTTSCLHAMDSKQRSGEHA